MAAPYRIIEAKDAASGAFRMERCLSAAKQPAGPARKESAQVLPQESIE